MANKRKIFFRADAGPEIGYGHYIRSLALADMLKQDFDCTMFTQTPTEYQLHEAEGICTVIALPNDDSKFDKFLRYLQGNEIVVLDNYFYTLEYQNDIRSKGCKIVCLYDAADKHYVADVVINQCLGYSVKDFVLEPYASLYMGLKYTLLRRPFVNVKSTDIATSRQNGGIVLAFGGSDPNNLTEKYVTLLLEKPEIKNIDIIIGDSYRGYILKSPSVHYYKNLSALQIRDLLLKAEYALLPASTMMREAMACGCKIFGGYYVDNQLQDYETCFNERYIYGLGDMLAPSTILSFRNLRIEEALFRNVVLPRQDFVSISERFVDLFRKL